MTRIAIIGAGLCGLTVAHKLKSQANITLFEKSAGFGGRLATRYADPFYYDHGAPYFKAETLDFQTFLQPLILAGILAQWKPRLASITFDNDRLSTKIIGLDSVYIGLPHMNAIGAYLAEGFACERNTMITKINRNFNDTCWNLISQDGAVFENFDWVVIALPSEQSTVLLPETIAFYQDIKHRMMNSCVTLMLGLNAFDDPGYDIAFIRDSEIEQVILNHQKPDRTIATSIVAHTSRHWLAGERYLSKDEYVKILLPCVQKIIGFDLEMVCHCAGHLWKYAGVNSQESTEPLVDTHQHIAVGGDWCADGTVEGAYLAGSQLARSLSSCF